MLWTHTVGSLTQLVLRDGLALAATSDGLQLLDVSGAGGAVEIGGRFGGDSRNVAWTDEVVYVSGDAYSSDEVLVAWDVGDPAAPVRLGRARELGSMVSVFGNQVASTAGTFPVQCQVTSVENPGEGEELPPVPGYALSVHPNPFNPQTTLSYERAAAGPVQLVLYDLAGRRVRTLVDAPREAGRHAVIWDGCDDRGRAQASGVYLARLTTEQRIMVAKLVLTR